jgi:hypothetical protein
MSQEFDFGRGTYPLVRSADEFVPGQKYLIRLNIRKIRTNPLLVKIQEIIVTYVSHDINNIIFQSIEFIRFGYIEDDGPHRGLVLNPYSDFTEWEGLEPGPNISFKIVHMSDNPGLEIPRETMDYLKKQFYSLGADGDYITHDSPPNMIRSALDEASFQAHNISVKNDLPQEITRKIKGYFGGGKRRRTKKSRRTKRTKKSRRRTKKSRKIKNFK